MPKIKLVIIETYENNRLRSFFPDYSWARGSFSDLRAYKMSLSGNFSFPIKLTRHDEFYLGLKIAPSYGIFVRDNLEQRVQVSVTGNYIFSQQERIVKTQFFGI